MARPTKPGNAERGWNDPPVFLHTPTLSGSSPAPPPTKRTILNKRVAHPGVASTGTSPSYAPPPLFNPVDMGPPLSTNVVLLPPSSTVTALPGTAPLIIPNMQAPPLGEEATPISPVDEIEVPDFGDDNQMYLYVSSHLRRVHRECGPSLPDNLSKEIERKLEVFEKMWESGRISYQVKSCMAKLSIALCRRQCDLAHEIHLALMMDYVSEVGQWMVGVKRLIQEARSIPAISSPDALEASAPQLIQPQQENEPKEEEKGPKEEEKGPNEEEKEPKEEEKKSEEKEEKQSNQSPMTEDS